MSKQNEGKISLLIQHMDGINTIRFLWQVRPDAVISPQAVDHQSP